jgi:hypothetical protein
MVKLMRPADEAQALSVRERVLLLCVASNTNWLHAGVPGETVTAMIVKGLITPDGEGLALTDRGRAVLRAMRKQSAPRSSHDLAGASASPMRGGCGRFMGEHGA